MSEQSTDLAIPQSKLDLIEITSPEAIKSKLKLMYKQRTTFIRFIQERMLEMQHFHIFKTQNKKTGETKQHKHLSFEGCKLIASFYGITPIKIDRDIIREPHFEAIITVTIESNKTGQKWVGMGSASIRERNFAVRLQPQGARVQSDVLEQAYIRAYRHAIKNLPFVSEIFSDLTDTEDEDIEEMSIEELQKATEGDKYNARIRFIFNYFKSKGIEDKEEIKQELKIESLKDFVRDDRAYSSFEQAIIKDKHKVVEEPEPKTEEAKSKQYTVDMYIAETNAIPLIKGRLRALRNHFDTENFETIRQHTSEIVGSDIKNLGDYVKSKTNWDALVEQLSEKLLEGRE